MPVNWPQLVSIGTKLAIPLQLLRAVVSCLSLPRIARSKGSTHAENRDAGPHSVADSA